MFAFCFFRKRFINSMPLAKVSQFSLLNWSMTRGHASFRWSNNKRLSEVVAMHHSAWYRCILRWPSIIFFIALPIVPRWCTRMTLTPIWWWDIVAIGPLSPLLLYIFSCNVMQRILVCYIISFCFCYCTQEYIYTIQHILIAFGENRARASECAAESWSRIMNIVVSEFHRICFVGNTIILWDQGYSSTRMLAFWW